MAEPVFALKGGTAINLFEWDLLRLSVDIDLTYLSMTGLHLCVQSVRLAAMRIAGERLTASCAMAE